MVTAAGREDHDLAPVTADVDASELVRQAIVAFARELRIELPGELRVVITQGTKRARVLDLHAGALVALLNFVDQPVTVPVQVDLSDVIGELLHHEERFWLGTARASGLLDGASGLTPTGIRRIVAAGCLLGATSELEALNVIGRVPDVPRSTKLAEWLRELYPPEPASGEWLGVLQPDRLAESHVVTQLATFPALAQNCFSKLNKRQAIRAASLLVRAAAEHAASARLLNQLLDEVPVELEGMHETLMSIARRAWRNDW